MKISNRRRNQLFNMRQTWLILLFFTSLASAQDFNRESKVPNVPVKGFYKILLPPDINRHLKPDFSDIRIYDKNNKEVPYLHQWETPSSYATAFREYIILENKHYPKCCTHLILHNPEKKKLDNITLSINNADVTKNIKISGSDDRKNWFAVKDYHQLNTISNTTSVSEIKILDFPLSNYEYYKISIDDSLTEPLKIIKAGYYDILTESGKYTELPSPALYQHDSTKAKTTYLKLTFNPAQYIDKLVFETESMPFFLREAKVCIVNKNKQGKSNIDDLEHFRFSSDKTNTLYFSNYKTQELLIIINNEDNPPLKIKSVKAYQLNHYLAAYLEKDESYKLRFSNEKVQLPDYDIKYFSENISNDIPVLIPGKVTDIRSVSKIKKPSFFNNKLFIWAAIITVILLLGFMSVRMIKEMK